MKLKSEEGEGRCSDRKMDQLIRSDEEVISNRKRKMEEER